MVYRVGSLRSVLRDTRLAPHVSIFGTASIVENNGTPKVCRLILSQGTGCVAVCKKEVSTRQEATVRARDERIIEDGENLTLLIFGRTVLAVVTVFHPVTCVPDESEERGILFASVVL